MSKKISIEFTQEELKHLEKVLRDRERKEEHDYRQFTIRFREFIASNKDSIQGLSNEFNSFLEVNNDILDNIYKAQKNK